MARLNRAIEAANRSGMEIWDTPKSCDVPVEDLDVLVKVLREKGCNVLEKIDDSEYGKFGWIIDPEGDKIELWQPRAGQ